MTLRGNWKCSYLQPRSQGPRQEGLPGMELAPQGVTDTGTRSQPPPGLGQGLPATRIPASPGSLGTSYHHPRTASEAAQQTCPPRQLAPTQRKRARERGRLLGPTCSGSDTPPPLMASLARINYGAITILPNVQEPFNCFHSSVTSDSLIPIGL